MYSMTRLHAGGMALVAAFLVGALAACGSVAASATRVDPPHNASPTSTLSPVEEGQALFTGRVSVPGFVACIGCHSVDPSGRSGIGPNLANIARRAGERVAGMSAEEYIERSIRVHDEYVVPGYAPGLARGAMGGRDFAEVLTDAQIAALAAYLMSLPPPEAGPAPERIIQAQPSPSVTRTARAGPTASPVRRGTPTARATATASPTARAVTPTAAATATSRPTRTALPSPTPLPAPTPTSPPAPVATPTPEALPSLPDEPNLARFAGCVDCHNQHPNQVRMPHPLNPTCNDCHRGSPNRIGCPTCHSTHGVDNKHEPLPDLACATCHK